MGSQHRLHKLMIAGGGTGGHVLAGIAVADAWRTKWGMAGEVRFVGARGGLEEVLVPKAEYPLYLISIGTLNRVSWKQKFLTVFQLPGAILRAMIYVLAFRPDWVVGVGGYASGPVLLAARMVAFFRLVPLRVGLL